MKKSLFFLLSALAVAGLLAPLPAKAECYEPPAAFVVWSKCEFKRICADPKKEKRVNWCKTIGLEGADLSGARMEDIVLHHSNLKAINLEKTDLRGADLSNTDLSGANLKRARLNKAIIKDANLSGADLSGANLEGADLVVTGEGCLDYQTVYSKAPIGVAARARERGIPVVAISGSLGERYGEVHHHGIDAAMAITSFPMTLDEASEKAAALIADATEEALRFMRVGARVFS